MTDIKKGDTVRVHGLSSGPVDIPVAEVIDKDGSVTIMPRRTLTLTDFLLARIAEDAESAEYDIREDQRRGFKDSAYAEWGWSPVRVLAECEAKRVIIGLRERLDQEVRRKARPGADDPEVDGLRMSRFGLDLAIKVHAAVYADHPDYREEWKP